MDTDFWHARWEANKTGFHQGEINPYLVRYWKDLGLGRGDRVFAPLCGKSLDMIWLLDQGFCVVGVEISPIAVEAFFSENNISPVVTRETRYSRWAFENLEILCGNLFALNRADIGECRGLYDRAALIALPPDMRPGYTEHLKGLLNQHTRGLLITLDYNQQEMTGPPFSVSEDEVRRLFGNIFSTRLLCSTDILAAEQKFREQGLTRLVEQAWRLGRLTP